MVSYPPTQFLSLLLISLRIVLCLNLILPYLPSPILLILWNLAKWNAHSGYFTEFAAQGSQTSAEHAAYIKSKARTRIVYLNEIRVLLETFSVTPLEYLPLHEQKSTAVEKFKEVLNNLGEHIFVSFDLDAVSSADAPVLTHNPLLPSFGPFSTLLLSS